MHKYLLTTLLISSCIALHGASPERPEHSPRTEPFAIIDMRVGDREYVSDYDIGDDKGATDDDFNMLYYPKDNPFIVFGQKQASPKGPVKVTGIYNERVPTFADAVAIKTNVSAVHVGGALILLHSKSGNHENLAFVQDNFFKPFLIKDFLPSDFKTILTDQLGNLSGQMKLYEEQAADRSTQEGKRAFEFAKALRQKDDFVKCCISYLTFDSYGTLRCSKYTFGLPQRASGKNEAFSDFFKLTENHRNLTKEQEYTTNAFALGLTRNCMRSKQKQGIIQRNVDKLGLLLAAHKYGHEIKKGIKDDAQASFVMFDLKSANLENKALEKARAKEKEEFSRESSDTSEEQSSDNSDEEDGKAPDERVARVMAQAGTFDFPEWGDSSEGSDSLEDKATLEAEIVALDADITYLKEALNSFK